jgi:hypothetical protein
MADQDTIARAIQAAHAALIARNQRDMELYGSELPDGDLGETRGILRSAGDSARLRDMAYPH